MKLDCSYSCRQVIGYSRITDCCTVYSYKQRCAIVRLVSRPNIKNAVPKINTVARVLIEKWAQRCAGGKGMHGLAAIRSNVPTTIMVQYHAK